MKTENKNRSKNRKGIYSKEDKKMYKHEYSENNNNTVPVMTNPFDAQSPTPRMQMDSRPKIDDVVCHHIDGEKLKEALFVIENIRQNEMKIKWFAPNVWTVRYKGRFVCDLRINQSTLIIGEISGVLAKRVRRARQTPEHIERFINALRESITAPQSAYAVS